MGSGQLERGEQPGTSHDSEDDISRENIFETLSNERRRMVVDSLREDGAVELRELSRQVAGWENDVEPKAVTSAQRRRVYNALQQSHLPKMDANGIVEYDRDRGTVEPADALSDVTVYLEVVPEEEISWGTYYTLLGTALLSLNAAVALGLYPFSLFGLGVTAVCSAACVVISGLVHVYRQRRMAL